MWQQVGDFLVFIIKQLCLVDSVDEATHEVNNDKKFPLCSRSIASHRILDERGSVSAINGIGGGGGGGRRRASSIHGSINGAIINERDNLDIKLVRNTNNNSANNIHNVGNSEKHGRKISNSVQAQIERMFTDVAIDTTASSTFNVRCLGSLPLKDKVTSLVGLQEPLRQLYLSGAGHGVSHIINKNTLIFL